MTGENACSFEDFSLALPLKYSKGVMIAQLTSHVIPNQNQFPSSLWDLLKYEKYRAEKDSSPYSEHLDRIRELSENDKVFTSWKLQPTASQLVMKSICHLGVAVQHFCWPRVLFKRSPTDNFHFTFERTVSHIGTICILKENCV